MLRTTMFLFENVQSYNGKYYSSNTDDIYLLLLLYMLFAYVFFIVISYFILRGTFRYTGIWRSCIFLSVFFVYILLEVKCKFIIINIYICIYILKYLI